MREYLVKFKIFFVKENSLICSKFLPSYLEFFSKKEESDSSGIAILKISKFIFKINTILLIFKKYYIIQKIIIQMNSKEDIIKEKYYQKNLIKIGDFQS